MSITERFIQFIIIVNLKLVGLFSREAAQRGKRMLFLTSLSVALAREGIIKNYTIKNLNKNLELAKDETSMVIAESLSHVLWNTGKVKDTYSRVVDSNFGHFTFATANKLSDQYIADAPKWIHYNEDKMRRDVENILLLDYNANKNSESIKAGV